MRVEPLRWFLERLGLNPATTPRRLKSMAALVMVGVIGAGGSVGPNVPPPGTIWFARSFDPDTYEVHNRLTFVGPDDTFFMVGQLPRSVAGSRIAIREYLDGDLFTVAWTLRKDVAGIWGFSLGPLRGPGLWRYEIAEIGGDVLASGQIVARK
jgi:hypothetical protein